MAPFLDRARARLPPDNGYYAFEASTHQEAEHAIPGTRRISEGFYAYALTTDESPGTGFISFPFYLDSSGVWGYDIGAFVPRQILSEWDSPER